MSEQQPSGFTNSQTIIFMIVLSVVCALILSLLASALAEPKDVAKDLDRSKQMMIAAKILSPEGYFILENPQEKGKFFPAKATPEGGLVAGEKSDVPSRAELQKVYQARFQPMLVDSEGNLKSFKEAGLDEEKYTTEYKKTGYYKQPLKLLYTILPNPSSKDTVSSKEDKQKPIGYVIPVNGFGLWDAIYGYLALEPDADTIKGISWYDQKETPGLGANIAEPDWQAQFPGKTIFQSAGGADKTELSNAPLGITVVKGKVSEVLGTSPKAKSAVDGMTGATLTGNGVTDAYRDTLAPYRPFFVKANAEYTKTSGDSKSSTPSMSKE